MTFNLAYIQERRKSLGITIDEMSQAFNFKNSSTYWKYEHGDYTFDVNMLPVMAMKLKCDISDFYTY